jgi:glycosyltransferase involved in cell wall biosynthesis
MRILVITNLFPSSAEPRRGLFNLEQLRALAGVDTVRVVCPQPGYPGASRAPRRDTVDGIPVDYPRYPYVPKLGQVLHDRLFEHGTRRVVDDAVVTFRPDLVYATWSYPDVVAAGRMAARHGVPLVAKVHGTDINDYFGRPRRRRLIIHALSGARAVIAVSAALAGRLRQAGVDPARVHVIPNGVDTARFAPRSRAAARAALGIDATAPTVLFVGNLKPVKGIDILLDAVATMVRARPALKLFIIGGGPLHGRLRESAVRLGLDASVRMLGEQPPEEIARWMNAADVLCLPSRSEGMPNVVLEAGASGLPVVATRVGGIPEILAEDAAGYLVPPADPAALAGALERALARAWDPRAVRAAMQPLSWAENAARLRAVMDTAARGSARA